VWRQEKDNWDIEKEGLEKEVERYKQQVKVLSEQLEQNRRIMDMGECEFTREEFLRQAA
jgi:predicted ATP-grasp superfamily ATP-dependent carboligase